MSQVDDDIQANSRPVHAVVRHRRVWKPLDVGGLRLYEVRVYFANHPQWNERHVVAAKSPMHAADIYKRIHSDAVWIEEPYIKGFALNINMPADWWDKGAPCLECEPERWQR
jgi:hypothetical protein